MAWVGDTTPYEIAPGRAGAVSSWGRSSGCRPARPSAGFAAESGFWQWPFAALAAWFLVVGALLGRAAWRQPSGAHAAGGHLVANLLEVLRTPGVPRS